MDQREFNRQMGSYLRERKDGGGFWKKLKSMVPSVTIVPDEEDQEPEPEEVPVEKVQAVMRGESVEPAEDDEFEAYEAMDEQAGFFERLSQWIFGSYDRTELLHEDDVDVAVIEQDVKPEVDRDVKEMLRVCVRWVNRLPPEEIQAIKREDEYREFKALLDKYGLLKKE